MILPEKIYQILKWCVLVCIPALTTAYVGLAAIWGWPYAEAIVGTIAAVDTFLGALVIGLRKAYNKKEEQKDEEDLPFTE